MGGMAGAIYNDLVGFGRINSSNFEVGMAFHVGEAVTIDGLQWYRAVTGTGIAPEIVRLWRVSDTSELGRLTSVPDNGAVGWQHGTLATPISLVAGEVYVVAGYFPGAGGQPSTGAPGTLSPALTITLESAFRRYRAGSSGYPSNADAGSYIAMDVTGTLGTGGGGGTGGATPAEVGDELAKWLSTVSATNTHHDDSAPYKEYALATGATGFDAIKAVADAIASIAGGLPGTIIGGFTTVTGQLTTMTTTFTGQMTALAASLAADLVTINGQFDELLGGLAGRAPGALSGRTAFPTDLWTLVDEADFDGDVAIRVAADLYAITIDVGTSGLVATPIAGVDWYPRAGWWCLLNGTFASERHYFDFANVHLQDQGRRMPGALIHCRPGCTGHWQAWALT